MIEMLSPELIKNIKEDWRERQKKLKEFLKDPQWSEEQLAKARKQPIKQIIVEKENNMREKVKNIYKDESGNYFRLKPLDGIPRSEEEPALEEIVITVKGSDEPLSADQVTAKMDEIMTKHFPDYAKPLSLGELLRGKEPEPPATEHIKYDTKDPNPEDGIAERVKPLTEEQQLDFSVGAGKASEKVVFNEYTKKVDLEILKVLFANEIPVAEIINLKDAGII